MDSEMDARMNSSAQQAACAMGNYINTHDKTDHVHYHCAWQFREDRVYHICSEQKREWEI